jgi:hypothetical protein
VNYFFANDNIRQQPLPCQRLELALPDRFDTRRSKKSLQRKEQNQGDHEIADRKLLLPFLHG